MEIILNHILYKSTFVTCDRHIEFKTPIGQIKEIILKRNALILQNNMSITNTKNYRNHSIRRSGTCCSPRSTGCCVISASSIYSAKSCVCPDSATSLRSTRSPPSSIGSIGSMGLTETSQLHRYAFPQPLGLSRDNPRYLGSSF